MALRSRILLACAEGRSNQDVAAACGVSTPTVGMPQHTILKQ
ncbi:MAG: helix-turn-helix domain-containing protein [Solirubrobacteraceae bacterium]